MPKNENPPSQDTTKKYPWKLIALSIVGLLAVGLCSYSIGRWHPDLRSNNYGRRHVENYNDDSTVYNDFRETRQKDRGLRAKERSNSLLVPGFVTAEDEIENIDNLFARAEPVLALWRLKALQAKLNADASYVDKKLAELALAKQVKAQVVAPAAPSSPIVSKFIPILLYHKTPVDFEAQLGVLQNRGYTTITMAQVGCGLRGSCALPAKPVVITFDDGFSDQLRALDSLKKYNMRGTFYMIIGGDRSKHCIGIERTPGAPCGDAYLNWDETKQLAASPLVEIGAHTVDHLALASLSAADQTFQMQESKRRLEEMLGRAITTLAYPYGSFTAITAQIAQQLGFSTAVSTIPGSDQTVGMLYSLHRIRDTYKLP